MRKKRDPKRLTAYDFTIVTTEFDRNNGITSHSHKQAPSNTALPSDMQWRLMPSCATPTLVPHDQSLPTLGQSETKRMDHSERPIPEVSRQIALFYCHFTLHSPNASRRSCQYYALQ